jgi:hypothetical protein
VSGGDDVSLIPFDRSDAALLTEAIDLLPAQIAGRPAVPVNQRTCAGSRRVQRPTQRGSGVGIPRRDMRAREPRDARLSRPHRDPRGLGRHRHLDRRNGLRRARPRPAGAVASRRDARRRPLDSAGRPHDFGPERRRPAGFREGGLSPTARIRAAGLRALRADGHASQPVRRKLARGPLYGSPVDKSSAIR